jgi:hypothetical protein
MAFVRLLAAVQETYKYKIYQEMLVSLFAQ